MATFVKRGRTWSFSVYMGRDSKGKKQYKWFSGGWKTKKAAKEAALDIETEIKNGTYVPPNKLTVANFLRLWLSKKKFKAETTQESYEMVIEEHIIPVLGDKLIQKLKALDVEDYYNYALEQGRLDGKGGLSPTTVNYHHRIIRKAFKWGFTKDFIKKNIMDAVEAPTPSEFEPYIYDEEDFARLLDAAENDLIMGAAVHLGCILMGRRGEVLATIWPKINLNEKVININKQKVPTKKGVLETGTKTKTGKGIISIPQITIDFLRIHKKRQLEMKLLLGSAYHDNKFVVCREDGREIHPSTFSHMFANFLKKNNLPHIRFHDLRHMGVVYSLLAGVDLSSASKRARHSTASFTSKRYDHLIKARNVAAAEKLNNYMKKARQN